MSAVYELEDGFTKLFECHPTGPIWFRIFDIPATKATGLKDVLIYLDAAAGLFGLEQQQHYGAGQDVEFVRAFAKLSGLKGLEKVVAMGYFAKE